MGGWNVRTKLRNTLSDEFKERRAETFACGTLQNEEPKEHKL